MKVHDSSQLQHEVAVTLAHASMMSNNNNNNNNNIK